MWESTPFWAKYDAWEGGVHTVIFWTAMLWQTKTSKANLNLAQTHKDSTVLFRDNINSLPFLIFPPFSFLPWQNYFFLRLFFFFRFLLPVTLAQVKFAFFWKHFTFPYIIFLNIFFKKKSTVLKLVLSCEFNI